MGEAAQRGFPALPYAQDVMVALGEELRLECMATAVVDGEIAILAKSGVPAPLTMSAIPGQRVPLQPPLASVFLAWWPTERVVRLMRRVAGPSVALDAYLEGLNVVRRRGFAAGQETPSRRQLGQALATGARSGRTAVADAARLLHDLEAEDYQIRQLNPRTQYQLNHIAAPVFDANGDVSLALTLIGFVGTTSGRDVERLGARLCAAAAQVTAAIHGRRPVDQPVAAAASGR